MTGAEERRIGVGSGTAARPASTVERRECLEGNLGFGFSFGGGILISDSPDKIVAETEAGRSQPNHIAMMLCGSEKRMSEINFD